MKQGTMAIGTALISYIVARLIVLFIFKEDVYLLDFGDHLLMVLAIVLTDKVSEISDYIKNEGKK